MATRVLLRPAPASATLLRHTPNVRPSRKKTSTSTAVSVRSEYRPDDQEEVPAAARIFATGVGLMLNAAGFAACYELNPSMRILAQFIEETQNPTLHTFFAKIGTIFASPLDVFLLTICLLLIEVAKWLDE